MKKPGRHPHNELTSLTVKAITKPGLHADGNGLYLKVDPSGARRWVQRLMIQGKRRDLGLGPVSLVSLAEAREQALTNRKIARSGGDPIAERQHAAGIPTFEEAARQVHHIYSPSWRNPKHGKQWIASLESYALPYFGNKKIDTVTGADILSALSPIWIAKPETALRVRQRIGTVMKWAMAQGWCRSDPSGLIAEALPRISRTVNHHPALPYNLVPAAISRIRASDACLSVKFAMEFMILTATRSGEVRGARWDEIDKDVWTIPAERMKTNKTHRVPLSSRCLEILNEARCLNDGSGLVFPGMNSRPLSDATLSKLLRKLKIACVPHGFRSSFRVWASEWTNIPREVCEFALAHVPRDKVEAAYQRSDLFDKRRKLMQAWTVYLRPNRGTIVTLRARF